MENSLDGIKENKVIQSDCLPLQLIFHLFDLIENADKGTGWQLLTTCVNLKVFSTCRPINNCDMYKTDMHVIMVIMTMGSGLILC